MLTAIRSWYREVMTVVPSYFNRSRTRALGPVLGSRTVEHIPRHDGWNFRLFFSRKVVFSTFSNFHDFCQQQTHTPARARTRHPAKHGSKDLIWGLDTAEHRLHRYLDHNSGCCSGYEPARGEAQGHYKISLTSTLPFPFVRCQEHSQ